MHRGAAPQLRLAPDAARCPDALGPPTPGVGVYRGLGPRGLTPFDRLDQTGKHFAIRMRWNTSCRPGACLRSEMLELGMPLQEVNALVALNAAGRLYPDD